MNCVQLCRRCWEDPGWVLGAVRVEKQRCMLSKVGAPTHQDWVFECFCMQRLLS